MGSLNSSFALTAGMIYPSVANVTGAASSVLNINTTTGATTDTETVRFSRGSDAKWEWKSSTTNNANYLALLGKPDLVGSFGTYFDVWGGIGVTAVGAYIGLGAQLDANLGVNLRGTTSPLFANGSAGTSGYVLTSAGAGATPTWTAGVTASNTITLTNKRVTPRILSAASYTTDTGTSLNCNTLDEFIVTAQAGALKFNNPTGTPTDGQGLILAVTGTAARALTWDTQFEASTVALPTTTVTTARLTMGFIWAAATSKWIIQGAA